MLKISETTLAALTREHTLERVHRFLKARSPDPALQMLLTEPGRCRALWYPWYDRFAQSTDHAMAVRLSYVLAAQAHGFDMQFAETEGEAAEIEMKTRLEVGGILAFISFDEG